MSNLKTMLAGIVAGQEVSVHDLLQSLQLEGQLAPLIVAAGVEKVLAKSAARQGITVTTEELQKALDAFRLRSGLNKAADTQRWLTANHLTHEDLEERLQRALVREKLADKIADGEVAKHFADNRTQFDQARLRQLVVEKQGVAQELLNRIEEEGADFAELARHYSIDQRSKESCGDLRTVSRKSLHPEMEAAVFAARNGAVVGPFRTPEGHYVLLKVEELLLGQLDPPTTVAIQRHLFVKWLAEQVPPTKVEVKVRL